MQLEVSLHIDGKWRAAADGRRLDILNPATEEVIGQVACAGTSDLEAAVAAAERAYPAWRKVSPLERSAVLRKGAEILRQRLDDIALTLTREQGKPVAEARLELNVCAEVIEWFAEEGRRAYGRIIPARVPGVQQLLVREPVGVVAGFTPWNFPASQAARKLAAAVAAGCPIILKGPEETPGSCAELVRAMVDAGLPDGVIQLVYGVPAAISEYLIPHPVVRKISFTGSTRVGKHLAAMAGAHMKRVTMELGGHSPAIVCNDADLDVAARLLAAAKFRNAGQVCIAPTRFLVQSEVYEPFLERFVQAAKKLRLGDGLDPETTMGPLANDRRVAAMEDVIGEAVRLGGKLVMGGKRVGNKGYFFEPTVLTDVPREAKIMNEEPFGPVALMRPFTSFEEAITESNRLAYGLAAYAYTRSAATAEALSRAIEAGGVSINHHGLGVAEAPLGGVKDSGFGAEGGAEGLEPYLVSKFVTQAPMA